MNGLLRYIQSTFNFTVDIDAEQISPNSKLTLLKKSEYSVYITPITFSELKDMQEVYSDFVEKATKEWSKAIDNKIKFRIIDTPFKADIKIYWTKSTRKAVGRQFKETNSNIKTLCVSIGIIDEEYNPYTSDKVYAIILHEFGHIMKLGHSPNPNDIMYRYANPTDKISDNDTFVLNLIYSIGANRTYRECETYIKRCILKKISPSYDTESNKNLLNDLSDIANINKDKLTLFNLLNKKDINKNT